MNQKPYLIAEIGINHNGDMSIVKKLIDNASKSGFDAVKFQKRNIDKVYTKELLKSERKSPWGTTQREQKEGLEFTKEDYQEIDNYCKKMNIEWFASAWDLDSLNFLDNFSCKYNKIASAMIVDKIFLSAVASKKKHTFISTGMSTTKDIDDAVEIFKEKNCSFELMHCVSTYPMQIKDANLETIPALKKRYKCDVGYSGHEIGISTSLAAFSMDISSLERHITLDKRMYGSDQSASMEMDEMIKLTKYINEMLISYGTEKIGFVTEEEKGIAAKLRGHIQSEKNPD